MLKKISIISLLAIIMGGCIKEDMSDCGLLRLQFSYTHNMQGENLLAEQVKDIRVYVFDSNTGLLADIIRPGREAILNGYVDIELPDGRYTFTAWGGGSEDLTRNYLDAEMADAATLDCTTPARIGKATLDNFRMMLACDPMPGGTAGMVKPKVEQFDDLFFAYALDITADKNVNRTVSLDFIKNTSTLKVKVTGLSHLSHVTPPTGQPLNVFVEGRNEIYGYDNSIDGRNPLMRTEPPAKSVVGDVMETDIRMQRLLIATHDTNPVLLYVKNPDTGQDMIYPLDIVDAILQVRNTYGNLAYRTQEEIDREEVFHVEISILTDLSVTVSVNGFEIVDAIPDLRP